MNRLWIPDADLLSLDSQSLQIKIQKLEVILSQRQDISELLRDRILFELAVYRRFLPGNNSWGSTLELDGILSTMDGLYSTWDLSRFVLSLVSSEVQSSLLSRQSSRLSIPDSVATEDFSGLVTGYEMKTNNVSPGSDILTWMSLQHIAKQLFTSHGHPYGIPIVTVIAAGNLIIGTSLGNILLFDVAQVLVGNLTAPEEMSCGSVTSLVATFTQKLLVAGYENGHIILWDISKKQLLKVIAPLAPEDFEKTGRDGHVLGRRIVHLTFVGPKERFVSADEEGKAFYHVFNRLYVLNSLQSTPIHGLLKENGSPTTVYALEGLPHMPFKYPGDELRLIALSTPYKLAIMNIKPSPQILLHVVWNDLYPTLGKPNDISCLAWCPARKKRGSSTVTDPILASSVQNYVTIYKVSWSEKNRNGDEAATTVIVSQESQWTLDDDIVGLNWIDHKTLSCITKSEEFVFCHVPTRTILERVSVCHHQIQGHIFSTSALQSLSITPIKGYKHTVSAFKGRLFCIGTQDILLATPVSWSDRLTSLINAKRVDIALDWALAIYKDAPQHVLIGLSSDLDGRKRVIANFIDKIILQQLLDSFRDLELSGEAAEFLEAMVGILFSSCLAISRQDILMGTIFELYSQAGLTNLFLDELIPHIIEGSIKYLDSPYIMQALTKQYETSGHLLRLQDIILKLDVSNLDIDSMLGLARNHFLFRALINVYNQTLNDFLTPIVEMMQILSRAEIPQKEDLLSVAFDYISHTLSGKSYPTGLHLSQDIIRNDVAKAFTFLFSRSFLGYHGRRILVGYEPFPYLSFLLNLDTCKFIQLVEALMVEEIVVKATLLTTEGPEDVTSIDRKFLIASLQSYIQQTEALTSKVQVSCLISRMYAKYRGHLTMAPGNMRSLMQDLVSFNDDPSRSDREQSILELVESGEDANIYSSFDASLRRYEEVRFWRLYEVLARSRMRLDLVIYSFLSDTARKPDVLNAIVNLLNDSTLSYERQLEIKGIVLQNIYDLADIDGKGFARLIMDFWPLEHANIVDKLHSNPRLQLKYLKGLFDQIEDDKVPKKHSVDKSLVKLYDIYFCRLIDFDPAALKPAMDRSVAYASRYPFSVIDILALAKEKHVVDAAVWILEKTGDLDGALRLIVEEIRRSQGREETARLVTLACGFCDGIKDQLDSKDYQRFYFTIFDAAHATAYSKEVSRQVMESMMAHIPLPTIFVHVIKIQNRASLGGYRDVIDSMLMVNNYEKQSYISTKELVLTDVYGDFDSLVKSRRKAMKAARGFCQGCRKVIHIQHFVSKEIDCDIVVMACQHAYHHDCIRKLDMKCQDCQGFSGKAKSKGMEFT